MAEKSPMAPERFPDMAPVAGVRLATAACGVRYKGRRDVLMAAFDAGTTVGGVFTRSRCPSAPVDWCRQALRGGEARGLIANSGNSNAFTGRAGAEANRRMVDAVAQALGCAPETVFAASTGVIGELLPVERIVAQADSLKGSLGQASWEEAAAAISTTDTFLKGSFRRARIGGAEVAIAGIAKGSGMIAPDMATMFGFFFTDARLPSGVLQALIGEAAERSFNCITVDSDTSTSDTVLLFATGKRANPTPSSATDPLLADFRAKLGEVALDLAQQIVKDGEGASKFVTVKVTGAENDGAARRIAFAIANSPLVKTAIAGEDANWGRIVMAVGKSGEAADRDRLAIRIGGVRVAENGAAVAGYDEAPVAVHMKGLEIDIEVSLGIGGGEATVWTCDLTHRYIDINADYRT
jgi:glutamate N-acetyltransferase/amino-acid N-acetyltransferase